MSEIQKSIEESIEMSRELETADGWALGLKLQEEVGEFSECLLKKYGYLRHKQLKESIFGEAADIMNVILSVLQAIHPTASTEDILEELTKHMYLKNAKYKKVLMEGEK